MRQNHFAHNFSALLMIVSLCLSGMTGCSGDDGQSGDDVDAGGFDDVGDTADFDDTDNFVPPQVRTLEVTDITGDGATMHGELTDMGTPEATDYGFCIGTSPEPDTCRSLGTPSLGEFDYRFEDLHPGKPYYVRGWAENDDGMVYADDVQFSYQWEQVSSGDSHSCAIAKEGTLWCWGGGGYGKLGLGDEEIQLTPMQVGSDDDWSSVSVDVGHSCAIRDDGSLWCWGHNWRGALGIGDDNDQFSDFHDTPQQVGTDTNWSQVSTGTDASCAIRQNNTLWCWGAAHENFPTQLVSSSDWSTVSSGRNHSCALNEDDRLYCWGVNESGQLGLGDETVYDVPQRVGSEKWSDVAAGRAFSCAIRDDHSLWCWGDGESGSLGQGDTESHSQPMRVGSSNDWKSVSTSNHKESVCALQGSDDESSLSCWGKQMKFAPGGGENMNTTPESVGDGDWGQVALGRGYGCGITAGGALKCWGSQASGRLGNGQDGSRSDVPTAVDSSKTFVDAASGNHHSCGVTDDGGLWCWGHNAEGELGTGDRDDRKTPVQIGTDRDWSAVTLGSHYTCAIDDDDGLWCWGYNWFGQLGVGNDENQLTPTRVGSDSNWEAVSAGRRHTCGLRTNQELWCWGLSQHGRLGLGASGDQYEPQKVDEEDWQAVSAGAEHTCALRDDDTLWCWGRGNHGRLGHDNTNNHHFPAMVEGDDEDMTWSQVSSGRRHTCAIDDDQALWCWGEVVEGKLGLADSSGDNRETPKPLLAGGNWSEVSSGAHHTCALREDERLWCWGRDENVGIVDGGSSNQPQRVDDDVWSLVATGQDHTLGLQADGTAYTWGANRYGKLGDGQAWVTEPVLIPTP